MSNEDFRQFVKPDQAPRLTKDMIRHTLDNYPPPFSVLMGTWAPLLREPFKGITNNGAVIPDLFRAEPSNAPVEAAAKAASDWLGSLDAETRKRVQVDVGSDVWRQWHNTPLILRDTQVELLELNDEQRARALEVVRASLSPTGYQRTREIMANNQFLGELNDLTNLLNYWSFALTIFGTPSTSEPWGWQFMGHHADLSCIFFGGHMVLSPVFMGLEPDHDYNGERRRMYEPHEAAALHMMAGLSDAERAKATLYDSMLTADQPPGRFHPDDGRAVGGAFQDNRIVPYEGLPVAALDKAQKKRLLALAEMFVDNLPSGPAEARMNEIERHLGDTHFAWIGKADDVNPFYFRIHSPVALIEFDHHSGIFLANKEPARFHVHTMVRTPNGGDYGADLLRQHYAKGGHDRGGAHSHDGGHTFHSHD